MSVERKLPSWAPKEDVDVHLTPSEVAIIGWWYSLAASESVAVWDSEGAAIFAKLGVHEEIQ